MDKYVGQTIGIYDIVSVCKHKDTDGHKLYHVRCTHCGYEKDARMYDIQRTKVCAHTTVTGDAINRGDPCQDPRIAYIYRDMLYRCHNPKHKDYQWYGAKGVKVCQEWRNNPHTFEVWALENGYADNLTIDRIDENNDYCPDNCRWILREENTRRAGKVNWITVNGITLTGRQWAERFGLSNTVFNSAIRNHGTEKTQKLIEAMLKNPPSEQHRVPRQSWFSVYGVAV